MALKQQGWKLPSLELSYTPPVGGLVDVWKTFPWSGIKIKNGFPNFPPFLTTFPRCENNFITSCWYQISLQPRSLESTSPNLPTGQVFIP